MTSGTKAWVFGVSLALLLAVPGSGSAQTRQGFWLGVGGGFGTAKATCDGCDSSQRENSGSAYLKGGYTINPHWLVGAEFGTWVKKYQFLEFEGDSTILLAHFSATATYYPQRTGGLFVRGGAGVSTLTSHVTTGNTLTSTNMGTGPSFIIGGGYDIPVGKIALTPAVNYWYGRIGDLTYQDQTFATKWAQNVVDFTFGVTFP
jgi:hypothetical protein